MAEEHGKEMMLTGLSPEERVISLTLRMIPPSSNNQYLLVRRRGKTMHIPSKELTVFKRYVANFPLEHPGAHLANEQILKSWQNSLELCPLKLEVSCTFYFQYGRIFTKAGKPKRLDCSNRLKSVHDCVAQMFGIDDCLFFNVRAYKRCLSEDAGQEERTLVVISCIK